MKKTLLFLIISFSTIIICQAQRVFDFPSSSNKIFSITIDTKTWDIENKDGILTFSPLNSNHANKMVCMLWAYNDPESETAIEDLTAQAIQVINTLLEDVEWNEKISDFENNGISFVGMDGTGYYLNDNGERVLMSTTVMLLLPSNNNNIVALVFVSENDTYKVYEASLLETILSIK